MLVYGVVVMWPALRSGTAWGLYDWDQHLFFYGAARRTVLEFGQFPFWNPWYCGGVPALANPQFPALSASFLLTLLFGVPFGLKLAATVHAFLGMAGGYRLAREHDLDRISALLAGMVPMASTVYTLHVAVGHTIWLATAYLPWALWAYVRSRDDGRYVAVIAVAFVAMILHGQLYLVIYAGLALAAWSAIDAAARRSWRPILVVALALAACGLLAAFKLLPMYEMFAARGYPVEDRSSSSLTLIVAALLRRDQALAPLASVAGQEWGWWEYGAYVGPVVLVLALVGSLSSRRGTVGFAILAALFLWIAAGWQAGLWGVVQRLPFGAGVRVPSRFILVTVFFLGLLAAAGLATIRAALAARGRPRLATALAAGVVLAVAVDLALVGHRPLTEAFGVTAPDLAPPGEFAQVVAAQRYPNRTPYATMFPYLLENRGVVNCFERFGLVPRATPRTLADGRVVPGYRGEVYVLEGGTARIDSFSPNVVEVSYAAPHGGVLVLNQNFYPGWRADDAAASDHAGLVATAVPPGSGRVRFWFRPTRFWAGALASAMTMLGLLAALATASYGRR